MSRITVRFDDETDSELWAAIQSIPPGQRNAHLKRLLEFGFRLREGDVLQRLETLERRMAEYEAGLRTTPAPNPTSSPAGTGPAGTPPRWKESLAALGVYDD